MADGLDGLDREVTVEHAERGEQLLRLWAQQVDRPGDHVAERCMTELIDVDVDHVSEHHVEALVESGDTERRGAARREFQGERDPVESTTEIEDRPVERVDVRMGSRPSETIDEER